MSCEVQKKELKKKNYPYLAYITFKERKKIYTFESELDHYNVHDYVVVETARGIELGKIAKPCEKKTTQLQGLKPVVRKATKEDLVIYHQNKEKAIEAVKKCAVLIKKLNLDMHLIEAEYTLDCNKIIFIYISEERVDFRNLLKELASEFKCRIELRQVGPRNKSKLVGGVGMCGMETCCSRFLNDFDVISINMAKNQMLALNVQKLSGQCGKLMCCLKYEDEQYHELKKGLPKLGSVVTYKGSSYRLTSLNVILKQAKIENKEEVHFLDFHELWPNYKGM